MNDAFGAPRPLDAPPADTVATVSAPTPVAAAFLLGCLMPEHAREAARDFVLHGQMVTTHDVVDGSRTWSWYTPGILIEVTMTQEGTYDGRIQIASAPPQFVDGDVVQRAREIGP